MNGTKEGPKWVSEDDIRWGIGRRRGGKSRLRGLERDTWFRRRLMGGSRLT